MKETLNTNSSGDNGRSFSGTGGGESGLVGGGILGIGGGKERLSGSRLLAINFGLLVFRGWGRVS